MFERASSSRPLSSVLMIPLGVAVMLVEDYVWKGLKRLMARLGRLAPIARIEAAIVALPPTAALFVFLTPTLLILPVKLAAVWAVATGHILAGLGVLIGAKLVATALFARIYTLCQPGLMSFRWFARMHDALVRAKTWAHAKLEAWPAWRQARAVVHAVTARARAVLARLRTRPETTGPV
ncbi:hypothetical protein [Phaeospirillum tilakii]|uniref:Transmembrane protein n=1 Tax=Phaeospirillum tilakii TaxID=741673 RepID=A0ABW5C581_9PROT